MKQLNQTQTWLSGFHRGDLQAIRDLFEVHFSPLLNFAGQIARDKPEAREIVTETFIKLLNRRAYFDNQADIKAFLYITTRNACMDFLRFARNGQPRPAAPMNLQDFDLNLTDNNNYIKANQVLLTALENLPVINQQVFRCLFMEGNTTSAAAQQFGIDARELLDIRRQSLHHLQSVLTENELYSTAFFVYFLTVSCRIFEGNFANGNDLVPSAIVEDKGGSVPQGRPLRKGN